MRFAHMDMEDRRPARGGTGGQVSKIMIATDGVFSMDGDIALEAICDLAEQWRHGHGGRLSRHRLYRKDGPRKHRTAASWSGSMW